MPLAQDHIDGRTPLGANPIGGGVTFRVWAPAAKAVHLKHMAGAGWAPCESNRLVKDAGGYWSGFVAGAKDGDAYRFYVVGDGGAGLRSATRRPASWRVGSRHCDCIVRDPPIPTRGTTRAGRRRSSTTSSSISFTSALLRRRCRRGTTGGAGRGEVPRRARPHPVSARPRRQRDPAAADRRVPDEHQHGLQRHRLLLARDGLTTSTRRGPRPVPRPTLNALLAGKGAPPLPAEAARSARSNQLKALIDVCHVHGIAVILDVVYNHAGGDFDDESLYFFDRQPRGDNNDSLYFTDQGWAGGLDLRVLEARRCREFLIDNAAFFADEYHVDGFRYDEVTVIDDHGGWWFCQDLTARCRSRTARSSSQIAEYWDGDAGVPSTAAAGGHGASTPRWSDAPARCLPRGARGRRPPARDALVDSTRCATRSTRCRVSPMRGAP